MAVSSRVSLLILHTSAKRKKQTRHDPPVYDAPFVLVSTMLNLHLDVPVCGVGGHSKRLRHRHVRDGEHAGGQKVSDVRAVVEVCELHGERGLVGVLDELSQVGASKRVAWLEVDADPDTCNKEETIANCVRSTSLRHKGHHEGVLAAHCALHAPYVFPSVTLNTSTMRMPQNCNI